MSTKNNLVIFKKMKFNNKVLKLINAGFNLKTINKLTEEEITFIVNRILNEQTSTSNTGTISVKKNEQDLAKNLAKSGYNVKMEADEAKDNKKNPWSICTAKLKKEFGTAKRGDWTDKQKEKYEKCVLGVKKSLKESKHIKENEYKTPTETNRNPKITKNELLVYLREMSLK